MTRRTHRWGRDGECQRGCGWERRFVQSRSRRRRDDGAVVRYVEVRHRGWREGEWKKVARGHTMPSCVEA